MRPEVITILKALANKNQSAIAMEKKTLEMLVGHQHLLPYIEELKTEIQRTKDSYDDRVPFYNFYLAVTLLKQNSIKEAKDILSDAILGFRILGWTLNEAIGEWFFSTIHYENEDYDRAQRACSIAIASLQSLIKQYDDESKYEDANKLLAYLIQLEILQDSIIAAGDASKSLLREYKLKLENEIEYRKRCRERVRPTIVAKDFYIYKILMPAHSVYSRVPDPKTEREKRIYNELINKVGFFEIIEKLEAFEREFSPTVTREELLDRINTEWERDVMG